MEWKEVERRLDAIPEWIAVRAEIYGKDVPAWRGGRFNQLPTFDYYYKNCVIDPGGPYDFTVRREITHPVTGFIHVDHNRVEAVETRITYSRWMGTAFNFNYIII